jgi:hypothetical protein
MLTRQELVDLFQEMKDQDVLSVYVDAEHHDPAQRDAWRVRLDGEIAQLRKSLTQEAADTAPFDRAWAHVDEDLRARERGPGSERGWVGFASETGVRYAEGLPARMPHLVRWQRGIHAAPYIRALKQERPVTVVLVDGRRARVFEQVGGEITELKGILADLDLGDLTDTGMRKGSARATGVRGETSTDQAQRLLEVAADRMHKGLADLVDQRAGQDGLVVLGGPSESARKLAALLPHRLEGRVAERASLHLGMSAAEVREETRAAAGDLSEGAHKVLVAGVVDAARAGGKGALGLEGTMLALEESRVDALLLSRTFIRAHPGMADLAVGLAFVQSADVEEVSGAAGAALDHEAHGIAARLRY